MKNSKNILLFMGGILCIATLGLMSVSADRELFMNISNAIQHIPEVSIVGTGIDDGSSGNTYYSGTLKNNKNLVEIDTNNFILGTTGDNYLWVSNKHLDNSNILGGKGNRIGAKENVIIGGSGNEIHNQYNNTIIGGENNDINCYIHYNTIIGGKNNNIARLICQPTSDYNFSGYSTIIGGHDNVITGEYSVIMGNNSSIEGNNSVALGSGSHIKADNSFLWTDGSSPETLETNDVFVIMAKSGAIINSGSAHRFAKLTLGGPLVLSNSNNQSDIQCGGGEGGGIIKMEKSDKNQLCLCSCDGSGWNSMFSYGACLNVCTPTQPECGTEIKRRCDENGKASYSGSCINGNVVEGTGAYFVDKNNIVHRSCQTNDGQVKSSCSGSNIGGTTLNECWGF